MVVTALTLFSGCVEEDEDHQLDLGEPMKKVNHYVGTESFNVDVDDIFGEKAYITWQSKKQVQNPLLWNLSHVQEL